MVVVNIFIVLFYRSAIKRWLSRVSYSFDRPAAAGNPNNYTGFYTGDAAAANVGGFWPVPAHGQFAMANDDIAGDLLCNEILILPELDFTGQYDMIMQLDIFHDQNFGKIRDEPVTLISEVFCPVKFKSGI